MTITPSSLRHRIDPSMAASQLGVPRQFLPDASGRLLVTPRGKGSLRVPVYGAAKPASTTTTTVQPGAEGAGQLVLKGAGFDQGAGSQRYASLFSVLELGARSGSLPVCTDGPAEGCVYSATSRSADLEYVGAGSSSDLLWFGVAARGQWATNGNAQDDEVAIDVDGDQRPDFVTYVTNVPGDGTTDVLTAITVDLASGDAVDIEPVNFNFGDVDTNVFDTDVMILPVSKTALGIDGAGSKPITYSVTTFTGVDGFGGAADTTDDIAYDAGTPALRTAGPLFADEGGAAVDYTVTPGSGAEALVLHLHGLPGKRAEVLDVGR
jgi:hypothetical protein